MENCDICTILPQIQDQYIIHDGEYWLANLRDRDQTLLGTTFITAKRHVPELDYLTPEEEAEFIVIRNAVLRAIRAAYSPVTFNISCLKNDAFAKNPDSTQPEAAHVHWHIKPRYCTRPIEFAGEIFVDPVPRKYLGHFERYKPRPETAAAIAESIRTHLTLPQD